MCTLLSSKVLATRSQIHVVGSSAVYPFAATVAERFSFHTEGNTPVVESLGTGGGFRIFCSGVGYHFPDVATASRPITHQEKAYCKERGVKELYEIVLGYDGIVLVLSKRQKAYNITREQLYLALADMVPIGGKLIKNPYQMWSDIEASLPTVPIQVFGPSPMSGTRDIFVELVMSVGCHKHTHHYPGKLTCHNIREDGAYIEIGANENMIIQKVVSSPGAVGIVSYSFMDQNRDRVTALPIEKALPTYKSIQSHTYPISRPLYVYIKKDHEALIPELHNFANELVEKTVSGHRGYLSRRGLIPIPPEEHALQRHRITNHTAVIDLSKLEVKDNAE